ncbi:MAG: amino acid adenylation domain-containing protein [Pyrinomonadaceae bacterium]
MSYESVQEMFSRAAANFGPMAAIDRGGASVTYAELEARSNRLANFLLAAGVERSTMVGLLTSDPVHVITGILAALKAGAVFVPLDPTFPDQRLAGMAGQVNARFYVTEAAHLGKLRRMRGADDAPARAVCLGETPAAAEPGDGGGVEVLEGFDAYDHTHAPDVAADPDAPCSVYFTSGSTGKPKAILGRLRGIDRFIRWEIEAVGAGAGTRVSQLASPSFDGFLKDAFVPLCVGGTVCAPESRDIVLQPDRLIDWLDIEGVEVLHCVPSVFRSIVNEGLDAKYFAAMRCIVMTGEPLYPADVKRWVDVFGDRVTLWNIYGTTETSLSTFVYEVKPEDVQRPSIPVGKPIDGSTLLLLNPRGGLCGLGAVGEVHIQSPSIAFGYYGEPELTSEVFIPNPLGDDPADIVHKTGDYGRLLKGGDLEHLGRRDQQVKVRGVRVELGEIENLLRASDAVADVAVVDREDANGNKFLAAYVTMSNGTRADELRDYLAERLPEAMVPSAFVELDQLPRTLNGKIDRKALPALELVQAKSGEKESPRTPVEEIVAGIWCEVLKLPTVGRTDNFFNLGGHSLLVTQVIARVRDSLRVELPVRSLFESPTVEQFSRLVEEQINAGRQIEKTSISPVPRDGVLPLSFSQQRMWFLEQLASGTSAFHIPLGVRLKGPLNEPSLEQTFGEIIRRHENLRTTFPAVNTQPTQVIHPPRLFSLPVVDLTRLPEEERERQAARLAQEETVRRFDLERGPLVRPTLLRMSERDRIVVCTMHHIVGDGQSFEVVITEMSTLYESFRQGQPSPHAELAVQYVDYAAWQREWLQGEALDVRLDYWRRHLEDAPVRLNLPQRKVRSRVQTFKGAKHEIHMTTEKLEALRELSRREGVTLFMTLLSGFVLLMNQYTGDEDIVVGSVSANRERAESERLIGILANTLVLRVDVSGEEITFRDVMRRVREVCLDAYAYQLPPELIREDMIRRGEERERLFDVWFQLEREKHQKLDMEGITVEWYLEGREDTRFELSMGLGERDEEIVGLLEYDHEIFTAKTTAQMLEDYFNLLEMMVAEPDKSLSAVSLTSDAETEHLSYGFVADLEV